MKLNLLKPYPGEIFFSWVSRNYLMLGISQKHFLELMFGKRSISLYSTIPFKGKDTEKDKKEYLDIVQNNSILMLFQPFMTRKDYSEVKEGRKVNSIKMNTKGYKVCPLCYQEDMKKYGETFLRIEHQAEGNYICNVHKIDLVEIESHGLCEFNNIESQLQIKHGYNAPIYSEISEMISEVINRRILEDITLEIVREKCHNRLKELGYYRYSIINQNKLINDIKGCYGSEVLSKLGCSIDDEGERNSWVRKLLLGSSERVSKPIRYIVLIRFLFRDIESFINYNGEYTPFGKGPWKCINIACEKYNETCIENVIVSKGKREGRVRGEWQCKYCGMKYTRTGPIEENDDFYKKVYITEYGDKWRERFILACNDQTMTLRQITKYMNCSYTLVQNKMKELNIVRKCREKTLEDLIFEKRKVLLDEVEINPDISRKDLRIKYYSTYRFLLKNDREWIKSCKTLPDYGEKTNRNKEANEKYWEKRDIEMKEVVSEIVKRILKDNLPVRITVNMLKKEAQYKPLGEKQFIKKMPLTKAIIDQYKETPQQYRQRIGK